MISVETTGRHGRRLCAVLSYGPSGEVDSVVPGDPMRLQRDINREFGEFLPDAYDTERGWPRPNPIIQHLVKDAKYVAEDPQRAINPAGAPQPDVLLSWLRL